MAQKGPPGDWYSIPVEVLPRVHGGHGWKRESIGYSATTSSKSLSFRGPRYDPTLRIQLYCIALIHTGYARDIDCIRGSEVTFATFLRQFTVETLSAVHKKVREVPRLKFLLLLF